ncbi:hypothetical protein BEWA_030300 [Theileria equi strain WA]|uniref:Uncharacterized protein n=1 Tax=Theileria equi strain WA TaxID=1537102 RepID=L0AX64_THEEQ|nr:hypothetical protein BEWA_030300 [Theileria equi strain WA]AFZ80177.1 hypothetical protein BEWA_030300 [Theileria equi strain WA]|eukprot:XP_004829843.1 hypothetical protein BEWA_030300 [Theileria equi strain WA]
MLYVFGLVIGNIAHTLAKSVRNDQTGGFLNQKGIQYAGITDKSGPLGVEIGGSDTRLDGLSTNLYRQLMNDVSGSVANKSDGGNGQSDDFIDGADSSASGSIARNDNITVLDPAYIKRVELEIKMTYGERELAYFRNMIKEFQKSSESEDTDPLVDDSTMDHMKEHFQDRYVEDYKALDDKSRMTKDLETARILVKIIKNEFAKFGGIQKKYLEPNIERFTQIKAIADSFGENTDTPCRTQAGCRRLEILINLCTYIRGGTQFAYDIFATMVHVLGSMLSVLCGCVFIGPVHICFLKNFPEWLKLELDKLCGTSGCRCNKKPHYLSVTATKEINNPTRGYDKHIHTLSKGGTFTLYNVKYNEELIFSDGLDNVFGVTEVSVYYGGEKRDIPFIIEINNGGKQYYFNENPSSTGSRNTVWTRKNDLNKLDNLKEKLEELSCKSSNSAALDILKHKNRDYYCDNKVNVSGHKLKGANDMYEFKQTSQNNQPFKVHSIQYNGTEIPIPIPPEGVKEISTFYWKHHLGKPLVVKVLDTRNQPTYYFNDGRVGLQWDKRDKDKIGELNNAIVEHNCLRNRTTTIDISNRDNGKKYCCTKDCENRRIKVTENNLDDVFPGFTNYEHSSDDKLPFTIGRIMKGGEKQKGILFPIKNAYSVSVYYATSCKEQPIFLEILYAKDGYREYKWYQRITQNGWDLLDIPENEDQINKDLRENFRKVAKLLSENKCNPNSLPEDSTKSFREYPEPNGKLTSPDKVFEDLKKHISNTEFTPPMGLKEEEEEDQARKQANLEGKKYVFTLQKLDKLKMKPGKTPPNTKKLMQIAVKIVNEVKQELPALVPPPLTPIPAASTAHSSGVIIDIQKSPSNGKGHDTYTFGISDQKVKLVKSVDPPGSGFVKLTHTKNDSGIGPFTVEKVIFGEENNDTTAGLKLNSGNSIKHLAVWYWKEKGGIENPLLVEIIESNNNYKYHANKGGWNQWYPHGESQLQGEELEQKLDDLNCNLNKAVTMDITEISIRNRSHSCGNKIEVSSQSITLISNSIVSTNTSSIKYSIHKIQDKGYKLAKIKYYLQGQLNERKRIKADELKFPIEGPVDIYTFYCENNPILIYVDAFGQKKWYKRQNKNNHDSNWVVAGELDGVLPEKIKNRDCENWEKLKGVYTGLNCTIGDCSIIPGSKFSSGSTTIKFTSLPPPQVIIKLSENKNAIGGETTYIAPTETPSVTIRVTETTYPTQDFLKYEHTLYPNKDEFTLKGVLDDDGKEVEGTGGKVTSVSAYYWTGNTDRALLVGVTTNAGINTYYRNSKNGSWKPYTLRVSSDGKPTKEELELLNCEINDVVQIDVTKTSKYCHDGHGGSYIKKVKVTDTTPGENQLAMYKAYEHTPSGGSFIISAFKKGGVALKLDGLEPLPLKNATRVVVYFCSNRTYNPLLIYIPKAIVSEKWFQSNDKGNTWKTIDSKVPENENDYNKILRILDELNSDCKPPSVTIDIYERDHPKIFTTYRSPPFTIEVRQKELPGITSFTEYVHTIHGRTGNYFTVSDFKDSTKPITERDLTGNMEYVDSVSVFYWTPLENPNRQDYTDKRGRPLLIKMTNKAPGILSTDKWYENKGELSGENNKWKKIDSGLFTKLALENKLNLLNCKLNNTVIIDISKNQNGTYDACKDKTFDTSHDKDKMTVSEELSNSTLGEYKVYKHTLNNGSGKLFHVVKFVNGRVTLNNIGPTPDNPILDVKEVRVYMCEKDKITPLLVYYNHTLSEFTGLNTHLKWYQNKDIDNDSDKWELVKDTQLSSPENHGAILDVLNCLKSTCQPEEPPVAEQFGAGVELAAAGLSSWAIFGGSTSGTLAGAGGLTGLGWWAFKRSRGDPWVRQI